LARVLLAITLGDPDWFKILGVGFLSDVGGEGREAVIIIIIVVPVEMVPSPYLTYNQSWEHHEGWPRVELCLVALRRAGCEVGEWIVGPSVRRRHAQTAGPGCAGDYHSSGTQGLLYGCD
jgi:hypothetical protein